MMREMACDVKSSCGHHGQEMMRYDIDFAM